MVQLLAKLGALFRIMAGVITKRLDSNNFVQVNSV